MMPIELVVAATGQTSQVNVNGEPLPHVQRFRLTVEAGELSQLELRLLYLPEGPVTLRGYFIPEAEIGDYLAYLQAKEVTRELR